MNQPHLFHSVICFCFALLLIGCSSHDVNLKSGDIVFVSSDASELAGAINDVTNKSGQLDFVHMALVEMDRQDTFFIHADTDRGVSRETASSFRHRYPYTMVYRIDQLSDVQASNAIKIAKTHLGKAYNFTYYNADSTLYCSQLIHLAFESDSIFGMNPMTFKNPESDSFNAFWTSYYDSLGIDIPEGMLGCNPNYMSTNARLRSIGPM